MWLLVPLARCNCRAWGTVMYGSRLYFHFTSFLILWWAVVECVFAALARLGWNLTWHTLISKDKFCSAFTFAVLSCTVENNRIKMRHNCWYFMPQSNFSMPCIFTTVILKAEIIATNSTYIWTPWQKTPLKICTKAARQITKAVAFPLS